MSVSGCIMYQLRGFHVSKGLMTCNLLDLSTDKVQILQNRAARVITGADYRMPTSDLLSNLGWSSLTEKRNKQKALICLKS